VFKDDNLKLRPENVTSLFIFQTLKWSF